MEIVKATSTVKRVSGTCLDDSRNPSEQEHTLKVFLFGWRRFFSFISIFSF